MFSTGFSSGAREGRKIEGDVLRHDQSDRSCASRPDRGAARRGRRAGHGSTISSRWSLHGLAVGVGHGERRAGAARRADGAEQVGALVALIGGLAGARAAPRPLPHEAVLLADAGFVLEPDLDRLALRHAGAVRLQRRREVFLKAATVSSSLAGWRGRALMCEKPSCFRSLPIVRS